MMTNLFSMFDPSTNFILNLSLNWSSSFMLLIILPNLYWLLPNNLNLLMTNLMMMMHNELKIMINTKNNMNFTIMLYSLLILILINNFMGLFPYIFTITSHLSMNLSLAFPLWMSMMMFGWMNKTIHMFTHLVPQGTPKMLIMFMVLIESISLIIRPITLTIRLTANMIAGHLLLTLLGNMGSKLNMLMISFLLFIQLLLLLLESAVAIIQSYVFAVLMTLYISEI